MASILLLFISLRVPMDLQTKIRQHWLSFIALRFCSLSDQINDKAAQLCMRKLSPRSLGKVNQDFSALSLFWGYVKFLRVATLNLNV